jgi:hypothetical protein
MADQATKVFRMKRNTVYDKQAQQVHGTQKRAEVGQAKLARGDRVENNLREWMNATRRHENLAEYSDVICTTSNGATTSAHVNLEWIAKLRSKKGDRRKNNTHVQTPHRFKATPPDGRRSPTSVSRLSRDYSEKYIPKCYYKPNPSEARPNKKNNEYKGNFSDIQHLTRREVLGQG